MKRVLVAVCAYLLQSIYAKNPDTGLNMNQIVESRGYPLEQHTSTTQDGYVLGLFRIPYSPFPNPASTPKGPILLLHGLLDSSYSWVCQSRNQSLGYLLADDGYDVWFGNVRGNTYSRRHTNMDPKSDSFWDFSFDEFAKFDMPTMINFILQQTGAEKLSYVGHSQGTTIAFAAFSTNPVLASKINFFVGLGPVWNVAHITSPVMLALAVTKTDKLVDKLGLNEFLPSNPIIQTIGSETCKLIPSICNVFLELICGPGKNIDKKQLEAYISQTPAGTSTKNMMHWAQGVRKGGFAAYDYGCGLFTCKNKDIYGTRQPPSYDINAFNVPTAVFYGDNDELSDLKDVKYLLANLPSLLFSKKLTNFAHLDFTWGMNAHEVLYPDVIQVLNANYNERRAAEFEAYRA